jgi:hypothetical protein
MWLEAMKIFNNYDPGDFFEASPEDGKAFIREGCAKESTMKEVIDKTLERKNESR